MERAWRDIVAAVRAGDGPSFDEQWRRFCEIHATRPLGDGPPPAWEPDDDTLVRSNIAELMRVAGVASYGALQRWSVEDRARFWGTVLERIGVEFTEPARAILDETSGPEDPRWLVGARLNIVDSCLRGDPERAAIVSGRPDSDQIRTVSRGELRALSERFAHGLRRLGHVVGDRVALYLPMTVECIAAYLGVVRAGGAVVSIADSFSAEELRRRMESGGARTVLTVASYSRGGRVIDLLEKVRAADARSVIVLPGADGTTPALRPGEVAWHDFLGDGEPFPAVASAPDDVTNVLFSSGTTGTPKAIPWTHLTPMKCAMDGRYHQDIHPEDVVAWPTNIGWMMGPWLIYASLMNDAAMALWEGAPHERGFATFVRAAGVTVLGVVPSLVRAWRGAGLFGDADLRHVRVFSSTGEPSNREDYLWLMSRTGYRAPVIEYLGGTEIGGGHMTGTVVQPASPATFTTVALGLDVVLLDDHGDEVAEGEMGELFIVPPSIGLSQRLLDREHHPIYYEGCPPGPNGERLRRHGDQFLKLGGGAMRAQGRADDTMNLGGIKVSSLELEQVIDTHPAVYESAAVAIQIDGEGAERLVVYAVLVPDASTESLRAELGRSIGQRLNPLFKIHDVVTIERLPRTASNKIMRRELRGRYASR